MILIEILLFILMVIGHAYYDSHLIEKRKKYPNHLKENIVFITSTFSYFILLEICTSFSGYSFDMLINIAVLYSFVFLPIRWIVFDLSLNFLRGKNLLYISNKKKNNSYIDTIFYNIGNKLIYVKASVLAIGIVIYNLFLHI